MNYNMHDIENLIYIANEMYDYVIEHTRMTGNNTLYRKFYFSLLCFEEKYPFMNDTYAPAKNLERYVKAHAYWAICDIIEIKTILKRIKQEHFSEIQNGVDPLNIWNFMNFRITLVSKQKVLDGHYADAVESAFKEINSRLKSIYKNKTGDEKDGPDLMRKIFTPNAPVLMFEDLTTTTGHNVQEGYMNIFAGSTQAMRNPKAHENLKITESDALAQLLIASHLMDKIDQSVAFTRITEQ